MNDIVSLLKKCGMILEGHYIGKNTGRHFHTFIVKEHLLSRPKELNLIGQQLAKKIKGICPDTEVIVGPVSGGAIIGAIAASAFRHRAISFVPIDKDENEHYFIRKEYVQLLAMKKVVIIDDIVRSGSTLDLLEKEIVKAGAKVLGAIAIINRSNPTLLFTTLGTPINALVILKEDGYETGALPDWLRAIPVSEIFGKPERTKVLIGVTGKVGVGKSTIINELLKQLPSAERVANSDLLKSTLRLWHVPETRERLLQLSTFLKNNVGEEATTRVLRQRINESDARVVLIDGVRGESIYQLLKSYDKSYLIAVICDKDTRFQRMKRRKEKNDEEEMTREEFNALEQRGFQKDIERIESYADFTIDNSSSRNALTVQIDSILKKINQL